MCDHVSMAGGDKDTSILDSSYLEAERESSHEGAGEGRLLLTDAWHTDQYAVSVRIMRVFIGQ